MSYELRRLVLQSFKNLHKTRMKVFAGDTRALAEARFKINQEYKKNKLVVEPESIKAMVQFGNEVELTLRTQVIQARQEKPGVYVARILDDTLKLENVPYNDQAIPEGSAKPQPCCQNQDKAQNK